MRDLFLSGTIEEGNDVHTGVSIPLCTTRALIRLIRAFREADIDVQQRALPSDHAYLSTIQAWKSKPVFDV